MIRGLYNAASGMLSVVRRLEAATNNLANAQTTGFKQDRTAAATFSEQLVSMVSPERRPEQLGSMALAEIAEEPQIDLSQGGLQQTGRELDIALEGPGFLTVETPDGPRYTRDGSLTRDAQGYLTTSTGRLILGEDGPILLPEGRITVDTDGAIRVDDQPVGRLQLAAFTPEQALERFGANEVAPRDAGSAPEAATTTTVRQGFVEASNVDLSATLTTIIELQRAYEANQRMVQYQDEMLARAANDIARPVS